MVNTTVMNLLKSLSKEEFKQFEDFINSPFFNKKTMVIKLFKYLKKFYPEFNEEKKLEKQHIYKSLYPGKNYNYGVMKNIIYELNKLGEKFIELSNYENYKSDQYIFLLQELMKRNLNQAFEKNLKAAENNLERSGKTDGFFYDMLNLGVLKNNFYVKNNMRTEKIDFARKSNEQLISYFLIKFFRVNYNNLIQKYNFDKHENLDFLDDILSFVKRHSFGYEPIILLYYNMFMTLYRSEDESYYHKLKRLTSEQSQMLSRIEQFNMYGIIINYGVKRTNHGNSKFYKDLFEVYNEMFSKNLYSYNENDYMVVSIFRGAAKTGAKLKKFEWTKKFIEDYSDKLHPDFKEHEIHIANLYFHFMKKEYSAAQEHLAKLKIETVLDKPYLYILQSMIYYETKNFEALIDELNAFKKFLSYDKILSVELKEVFNNFIKYLNELVKINIKINKDEDYLISTLQKQIQSEEIREKDWLEEKISELT